MTRINTVHPSDLTNEWLLAEWRELPRIPNTILAGKAVVNLKAIPANYKLGTGHVLFFYNKLIYLQKRHALICNELDKRNIKRDVNVCVSLDNLNSVHKQALCNDWKPSQADHGVLIERLQERFDLRKKAYHVTFEGVKHVIDCEHSFNWYCEKFLSKYF